MGMNSYNRVESLRRSIAMERPGKQVTVKLKLTREEALDESHDLREIVPNLTIADIAADCARVNAYCGLCFGVLQYATGQSDTAWLVNGTSLDAVFLEFFPQVFELGIEGAFNRVFGLSTDQFMVEFESFMNLPRSEQLKILPIS